MNFPSGNDICAKRKLLKIKNIYTASPYTAEGTRSVEIGFAMFS